jgi:polar amino acid transport system substrate-binding protein
MTMFVIAERVVRSLIGVTNRPVAPTRRASADFLQQRRALVQILRYAFLVAVVAGLSAIATRAGAAGPACEPEKLGEKYPSLAGKTIKIGADPETPPYVVRDGNDFNKVIGADVDLANAVLDCAGIKHEMFLGAWSGLLPATAGGQVDVFWDTLYYTPVRAKQIDYVLYMQAGTGALTQKGNPKNITAIDASCGTTYGVGLGTVEEAAMHKQDDACKAAGKAGVTIMTYPDTASGSRLVQSGRADIMLSDLSMVDSLAASNPALYQRAYKILTGFNIGAAVKKGNKDLLQAIYDGMQIMQANGTQKMIFTKYHLDPDLALPATIKTE